MTPTLDKTRSHGTVHGASRHGVVYEQDGFPYDAFGNLIEAALTPEAKAKLKRMKDAAEKEPAAPKGKSGKGVGKEEVAVKSAPPPPSDAELPVNLVEWLKGNVKVEPFKILDAVRERYAQAVQSTAEAARYLIEEENVLPPEQASPKIYQPLSPGAPPEPPVREVN